MMDPPRLLDEEGDDFERALLAASRGDAGSESARARCVTAATATLAVAKSASAGSALLLPVLKAGAVGLALGVVASGGGWLVARRAPTNPSTLGSAAPAPTPVVRRAAEQRAVPGSLPKPDGPTAATPSAVAPRGSAGAGRAVSAVAVESAPVSEASVAAERGPDRSLEREVVALDRVRRALAANERESAAQALAAYEREFGNGVLGSEASFLRVKLLLASGRAVEARELGQRFVAEHPSDAQARKIEQLLGLTSLR
jgi:hypothetical protein